VLQKEQQVNIISIIPLSLQKKGRKAKETEKKVEREKNKKEQQQNKSYAI
jgi:hypothetical protein